MARRTIWKLAAAGAACSLLATGCLGDGDGGGGDGGGGGGAVEIFGAFSGDEEKLFNDSLKEFEESSGIDVNYVASADFTTLIRSRAQGGDAPDIALFPQPGLVLDLATDDLLKPLADVVNLDKLNETLIPGFLDATTTEDGAVYGAPMRMAVKSIVWYPKPEFEAAGYTAPESWEDLIALSERVAATGTTPWCLGIESGADTGWSATDWMEELVLRTAGPEVYDQWVKHEIPFNDPQIVRAGELFGQIALKPELVLGGPQGIVNTPFGDAADPMFEDPPACFMHRQGNFISGFFPEDVQADLDTNVGTFVLPTVTDNGYDGQPILGGGDLAGAFNTDENTKKVMEFLTSDAFGVEWAKGGGWLSPHKTFDAANYPDETTRSIATLAAEADVFRFDGSDLMPASVGAGTFWSEMVAWISGQKDLNAALTAIEESWPADGQ